ncbi:hypothetical protein P7C71_g222, partial [Lecanoromycetidae sp. Uapishka_2]
MSPRRSSRARTTQPPPSASNSSSISVASGHTDRNARSSQKLTSPRSSVAARSQSSEDRGSAQPPAQARRTRSGQDDTKDGATNTIEGEHEDEGEGEEEITRCICGNQEYPGLPVSPSDDNKATSKSDSDPAVFAEDATGWFIQCDKCHVWQHGGCVGLLDETTSPEEYYCEQCHPDLHKITTNTNGRKHSLYIPVEDANSALSSPAPALKNNSKRSKDSKAAQLSAESLAKGRRSTMNSRDAAYEEEQLRRAIEESKREGGTLGTATETRKGKRSRSQSEERVEDTKRQRTTSGSASSNSLSKGRRQAMESEEETQRLERPKNIRGSEPSPGPPSRTTSARGTNTNSVPFIAPPPPDHQPPKTSHRKTGRPPAKKGRIGKNQYTKDRDVPLHSDITITNLSPAPSNISQNADSSVSHVNGNGHMDVNGLGKPAKPRPHNANKTTMNDMKRRVAGILQFISTTQIEMAGTEPPSTTKSSTSTNTPPDTNGDIQNRSNISGKDVNAALKDLEGVDEEAFAALSSLEMMEVLTRRLIKWQVEYGKPGEK